MQFNEMFPQVLYHNIYKYRPDPGLSKLQYYYLSKDSICTECQYKLTGSTITSGIFFGSLKLIGLKGTEEYLENACRACGCAWPSDRIDTVKNTPSLWCFFPPITCLINLVQCHSVRIALVEAVGVSERLQWRHRGQDVTKADGLPQQPQSDYGTRPPQHLHRTLLAAALQAHPIHLGEGTDRSEGDREEERVKSGK